MSTATLPRRKARKPATQPTYELWILHNEWELRAMVFATTDVDLVHAMQRAVDRSQWEYSLTVLIDGKPIALPPKDEPGDETDAEWEESQRDEFKIYELLFADDDGKASGILCRHVCFFEAACELLEMHLPYGGFMIRERQARVD